MPFNYQELLKQAHNRDCYSFTMKTAGIFTHKPYPLHDRENHEKENKERIQKIIDDYVKSQKRTRIEDIIETIKKPVI